MLPAVSDAEIAVDELLALLEEIAAEAEGARVRALGGIGVFLRTPDAPPVLRRPIGDLDVVTGRKSRREVEGALRRLGLRPELEFNTLQGTRRQIWWTQDGRTHVDLFLGEFSMCHAIDFEQRLLDGHRALPAADLLLTKLQIVELNRKDALDAAALLVSHRLGEGDGEETISRARVVEVLAQDWGFYTTATDNLAKLPALIRDVDERAAEEVAAAGRELVAAVDDAPKSRAFKLRARIGRRVQWYELPDESLLA